MAFSDSFKDTQASGIIVVMRKAEANGLDILAFFESPIPSM